MFFILIHHFSCQTSFILIVACMYVCLVLFSNQLYVIFNDILHMSFLAGTHIFKAYPAYTTTEVRVRTKCSSICSVSEELYL